MAATLNWDDLRILLALGRSGSLSEAARRLRVDHSTVARRIGALEAALGTRLFDRLPRGYVATAQGETLLERAAKVEEGVLAIERAAGDGDAIEGRVRIAAPPALASLWLAPRLGPLIARHPRLLLDLVGATAPADLSRRDADLALRLVRPEGEDLVVRRLGVLRYGLYAAPDYAAATPEADRVFLGYDDELAGSPQQTWLETHAGSRRFALLANDMVAQIAAARAGIGVAAAPRVYVDGDPGLVLVRDCPEVTRDLWLVVHPDLRRAARIRLVMDHLVALTAELRGHPE